MHVRAGSLRDRCAARRRPLLPLPSLSEAVGNRVLCNRRDDPRLLSALVEGAELVSSWRPADGWEKFFCRECGSHLYTTDPADPQKLSVRMGALDSDPGIRPIVHQFTAYAAAWDPLLADELPKFPERLPSGAQPPADAD